MARDSAILVRERGSEGGKDPEKDSEKRKRVTEMHRNGEDRDRDRGQKDAERDTLSSRN